MTEPDDIGPDGTVRLRCYLPSADTVWLLAGCEGRPAAAMCADRHPGGDPAHGARGDGPAARAAPAVQPVRQPAVSIVLQPDTRPAVGRATGRRGRKRGPG